MPLQLTTMNFEGHLTRDQDDVTVDEPEVRAGETREFVTRTRTRRVEGAGCSRTYRSVHTVKRVKENNVLIE